MTHYVSVQPDMSVDIDGATEGTWDRIGITDDGVIRVRPPGSTAPVWGLPESAASVLKHLLYRYGAPAVNRWLRNWTNFSHHEQFPGIVCPTITDQYARISWR